MSAKVALLAEGVDRNRWMTEEMEKADWSPSSRRAWIEMASMRPAADCAGSPSSRRAWIEI